MSIPHFVSGSGKHLATVLPFPGPTGALGSDKTKESESYTHGHHESVLRSHRARNVSNSAAYFEHLLTPGVSVLDVGCGPGTVTVDIARRVNPGIVVGVDAATGIIEDARKLATEQQVENVRFETANAYDLPFEDASFDIVHAHQLLQHLSDPVEVIRQMKRVAKPGGYIAVREADYGAMTWYPESEGLTEWNILYHEVTSAYGFQADAGRRLFSWFQQAGFDVNDLSCSAGTWCYSTPETRSWWGDLWAERCITSNFAHQAVESNLADDVALEELAQEWKRWSNEPDGWFIVPNGEVLARVN